MSGSAPADSYNLETRYDMRIEGLMIGVIAFGVIGVFHPIVIKAEYYFTEKIWPLFLIARILMAGTCSP
jgi:hypothetical protein